jgi:arsenite methyltransferase
VSQAVTAPYESPLLRQVTGPVLRPGGLALTNRAVELCGFAPGDLVLDLGCGLGASADHLAGEYGLRALGLDLSAQMLAEAHSAHPGLPLMQASAPAIPLTDASLDGVFCECVLSLTGEPSRVLRECHRVLKPGGRLILSDIYLREPLAADDCLPVGGCLGGAMSRGELLAMAVESGLEILKWEDHSAYLRELTAQLVWTHGSAAAFWGTCLQGEDCGAMANMIARTRPGYFLIVARRKVDDLG